MLAGVFGTMPRIHQISYRPNRSGDVVSSDIVSDPVPSSLFRRKSRRACRLFGPVATDTRVGEPGCSRGLHNRLLYVYAFWSS
jgi:hypothetical protein